MTYYFDRHGIPLKHLYKNIRNVRTVPPKDVKRVFLVTDIGHNVLPQLLDYSNLEYNNSYISTDYLYGNAAGVKNSLFEIQVIPVGGAK